MTPHEATQLSRATTRAHAQRITIAASGRVKATDERFFIVNGSQGKQYMVCVGPERLTCDCPAGQHEQICKHRALVHERLEQEKRALRTQTLNALDGGILARNTRPFSIWRAE